jgi:plastocyanin
VVRLTRHLALSADVTTLTKRAANEEVAWSAGLNLAIPRTPHTVSLHATNVNNATLQSSSRGTAETRYGFEFTIPVTLSRYFGDGRGRPSGAPAPAANDPGPDTTIAGRNTMRATMEDFIFRPSRIEVAAGTAIEWSNQGQVVHTVTAEDRSFDSGDIEPGTRHRITFARPGTYSYHCTPHPFMRGVVVVR